MIFRITLEKYSTGRRFLQALESLVSSFSAALYRLARVEVNDTLQSEMLVEVHVEGGRGEVKSENTPRDFGSFVKVPPEERMANYPVVSPSKRADHMCGENSFPPWDSEICQMPGSLERGVPAQASSSSSDRGSKL
ncbi:hypothetical protein AVEN_134413-1 [Araneus ventricosus]|uniref:Uncharacterized protein n=1 Tax=Araneus ventricosus TaxID=182803 RepID=A0A4Y2LBF2_ARAVE|nr:hypothetical protein AVEN_134413-1 [Araneus ventricosus]